MDGSDALAEMGLEVIQARTDAKCRWIIVVGPQRTVTTADDDSLQP